MTISSSLNAGVMGLNVNASRLATISDNIANSATYGYKRAVVDFSSLVINQRPSIYSAGGVRATAYRDVSDQGSLVSTGRSTDLAINGSGMIPVTNSTGASLDGTQRDFLMVPTGGFSPDENGFLKTQSGLFLLGWPTDSNGITQTSSRSSTSSLEPVNINIGQYSATATTSINLGVNLPANASPADLPQVLPIEYFNNLGLPQLMTFSFQAGTNPNSWTVSVVDEAGDPDVTIATFDISFADATSNGGAVESVTSGTGAVYDPTTGEVTVDTASGPVNLFIGKPGDTSGLTQLGTTFAPYNIQKNGSPVGDLQAVEITPQGMLEAVYNTGFRRQIFQIPVADVANPDGLKAQGSQTYSVSSSSGDVYLWDAGSGPTGEMVGYALMESNTDIASELTSLIETQRAYSSNAKIIQTVDEMLQETTNLKR